MIPILLLQIGVIFTFSRVARRLFLPLGQPAVVGEMAAGLMPRPSLELSILSPVVFSMPVLMAVITTLMTSPLITWLLPAHRVVALPLASDA